MTHLNPKNLTYDKTQPAFLQRLKAEYAGDRNNVQFARPSKSRLKTGDAEEDEPMMVDERGERVSREEWEGMVRREREKGKEGEDEGEDGKGSSEEGKKDRINVEEKGDGEGPREKNEVRGKQKVAEVGGPKKRKVVKVVGDGDGDDEDHERLKESTEVADKDTKDATKPKKKAKKIKLSFDGPDG
jgi:hypothetical protein